MRCEQIDRNRATAHAAENSEGSNALALTKKPALAGLPRLYSANSKSNGSPWPSRSVSVWALTKSFPIEIRRYESSVTGLNITK